MGTFDVGVSNNMLKFQLEHYIIVPSKLHSYFKVKLSSWILTFELCVMNCLLVLLYFLFCSEFFWHSNAKHK
jgi:hypothetical protein